MEITSLRPRSVKGSVKKQDNKNNYSSNNELVRISPDLKKSKIF